jgi:predicted Zn-dependent peptidase
MIRKTVLPSDIRIVTEHIPHVRSVSIGLWLDAGSRVESEQESGITHFIEHMFFKGTRSHNAFQIADAINELGGDFNAFTTHEILCLYAKVLDEHLPRAIEVLTDLYLNSEFGPDEIERERGVVLEEINLYNDTPEDRVLDLFTEDLWRGNGLGRPILGCASNVSRFDRHTIMEFVRKEMPPKRLVVSIAGNFDPDASEKQIRHHFGELPNGSEPGNGFLSPDHRSGVRAIVQKLNQSHFCLGTIGPSRTSSDRYRFEVLNIILGGGIGSRIFQEVRERRGLVYSIGSSQTGYRDVGYFAIAGAASPQNLPKVLEVVLDQVRKIYRDEVTDIELANAKAQLKGAILLALENTRNRMMRLGEYELYFGNHIPVDTVIQEIDAVSKYDVLETAEKYLRDACVTLVTLGPDAPDTRTIGSVTF